MNAQTHPFQQLSTLVRLLLLLAFSSVPAVQVMAQTEEVDEMKLIQRVAELQQQLKSDDVAERDQAEKDLIAVGVNALDHLEPVRNDDTSEFSERLSRVRVKLEAIAVASVTKPKPISVQPEMAIRDLLPLIKTQSGNLVEIPTADEALLSKKIKFDFQQGSFWQIIHAIGDQAKLDTNAFQSDRGVPAADPDSE